MRNVEELVTRYRDQGRRITPQRRMIFELLTDDASHPTVEDIFQRLQPIMPEVSRATVYNTLHELEEMGELHAVDDLSEKGTRYDVKTSQHHHLYCVQCHKLVDIDQDLGLLDLPSEIKSGFEIQRSQITYYGRCQACQQSDSG